MMLAYKYECAALLLIRSCLCYLYALLCGLYVILVFRGTLGLNGLAIEKSVLVFSFQYQPFADLEVLGFGIVVDHLHRFTHRVHRGKAQEIRILDCIVHHRLRLIPAGHQVHELTRLGDGGIDGVISCRGLQKTYQDGDSGGDEDQ